MLPRFTRRRSAFSPRSRKKIARSCAILRRPPTDRRPCVLRERLRPILEVLHAAAAADYCDWGMGTPDFTAPLTYVQKTADLGRVLQWSAAHLLAEQPAEAIADLEARAIMGHHITDTLLGLLVAVSFEKSGIELLRAQAHQMSGDAMDETKKFLRSSRIDADVARAMTGEMAGGQSVLDKFRAMDAEQREALLAPDAGDDAATNSGHDEAWLAQEMDYVTQVQAQVVEAIGWPDNRYRAWSRSIQDELPSHPLAAMLLPTFDELRTRLQMAREQRAMLAAGLEILQIEQVGETPAASAGAPFLRTSNSEGFELRSRRPGKPLIMKFDHAR